MIQLSAGNHLLSPPLFMRKSSSWKSTCTDIFFCGATAGVLHSPYCKIAAVTINCTIYSKEGSRGISLQHLSPMAKLRVKSCLINTEKINRKYCEIGMVSQLFLKLWKRDLPLLHLPRAVQELYTPKLKLPGFFFPSES